MHFNYIVLISKLNKMFLSKQNKIVLCIILFWLVHTVIISIFKSEMLLLNKNILFVNIGTDDYILEMHLCLFDIWAICFIGTSPIYNPLILLSNNKMSLNSLTPDEGKFHPETFKVLGNIFVHTEAQYPASSQAAL